MLRATFRGIRNCVRELLGVRADALARKFHETHDMAVKDEIERLLKEYGKLGERGCLWRVDEGVQSRRQIPSSDLPGRMIAAKARSYASAGTSSNRR